MLQSLRLMTDDDDYGDDDADDGDDEIFAKYNFECQDNSNHNCCLKYNV